MKQPFLLLLLLLPLLFQAQCEESIKKVAFTSLARGGQNQEILITPDSAFVTLATPRGSGKKLAYTRKLEAGEWAMVLSSLKEVTLDSIPALPSPTMKRAYDGARHSNITITAANDSLVSHSFDDEQPHQQLQELMTVIQQLRQKTIPQE